MPANPDVDRALEQVKQAHARFKTAELARHEAIVTASHVGWSLREISEAMSGDLSHEVIRGIVGPRFGVAFEWDREMFQISEPQSRALIYKADGYGPLDLLVEHRTDTHDLYRASKRASTTRRSVFAKGVRTGRSRHGSLRKLLHVKRLRTSSNRKRSEPFQGSQQGRASRP